MTTSVRNWTSFIDDESIGLDDHYCRAVCILAATQANENPAEDADAPDIGDPQELIEIVTDKDAENPNWWPSKLGRLEIIVKIKPEGNTPETLGPLPIDPNTPSGDLGRSTFNGTLKGLLEMAGTPFDGSIQVKIQRKSSKSTIGGWKGNVYIGEKEKKGKGGNGRSEKDDERDEMFDYLKERMEKQDEVVLRTMSNSANVIHASASAINAMRGANVAPPWMQGGAGGEQEQPIWMTLAKSAADMVIKAGLENQAPQPGQIAGQMLRQPVRPQQPGQQQYAPRQLPGPSHEPDLGYGEYMDEGDYDGYRASQGDLIDDGFEDDYDDDEYDEDYDEDYDDEDEEVNPYDAGFGDSGDAFEDPVYDEPEPEESPRRARRSRRPSRSSGNPLDGLSADEVAAALGDFIDKNQDKKAELKGLAMNMAGKLM